MMDIVFFNEDVEMPNVDFSKIEKWIKNVICSYNKKQGNINYIFCSDDYLLEINKKYLDHNYYTDIITFNYCENDTISGDIFVSTERVSENAIKYKTENTELFRVIVHGVLHLIGFDDHSDEEKQQMRNAEEKALKILFED